MSKRTLSWLRQHTTVEDILDDGIENGSDLNSFSESDKATDPEAIGSPASVTPDRRQPSTARPDLPVSAPISYIGVLIGIALIASGVWLFLFPTEMYVDHPRIRFARSFVEHVTPGESQIYGVAGFLLGFLVLAFAVYKPRR